MSDYQYRFISQISTVSSQAWNALVVDDYPFAKHEFLLALEESGAVGSNTGWVPHHLLIFRLSTGENFEGDESHERNDSAEQLIAAVPCYLKHHSYGEYVFDHAWANAYAHNGLEYYPKLVSAIPFTPISGTRFLLGAEEPQPALVKFINQSLKDECEHLGLSSWHILFPKPGSYEETPKSHLITGMLERRAVHFEWNNDSYTSFEDFLSLFSSRKRKNLRKERQALTKAEVGFEVIEGRDIEPEIWDQFYRFYQFTYAKRSGHGGYLPKSFFKTDWRNHARAFSVGDGEKK